MMGVQRKRQNMEYERDPFTISIPFPNEACCLLAYSDADGGLHPVASIPVGLWRIRLRRQGHHPREHDLRLRPHHRRFHS